MTVLTVPEVKSHLNITVGTSDDELEELIAAAEAAVEQVVGPLETVSVTSSVRGGGRTMVLPQAPVVSVTSITHSDGASVVDTGTVYLNGPAGVLEFNDGGLFSNTRYTVVYTAGRATIPPDLLLAVKELVRHYWLTQRGSSKRPSTGGGESYSNTVPGAAYAMPFRVSELLAMHRLVGVA